ncbi:Swr1 complex subunit Swc5 [Schizosaccharomyces japonicus yFS275]|uniref:SWR1-complex protein 5 n=1 Tax=Schizosaccharomyces japonicus (strain yFS275 / FY16936) TaxID=402676 RepID=B6K2J5_SCHJY|nr:Swr1 complex subunit Swc5 [Schizosaccharomyces japonicus yFS275]EEB07376.1 Swr1 complex subunit Swc5 [Schizosaccharomyces japonicus yFS275]
MIEKLLNTEDWDEENDSDFVLEDTEQSESEFSDTNDSDGEEESESRPLATNDSKLPKNDEQAKTIKEKEPLKEKKETAETRLVSEPVAQVVETVETKTTEEKTITQTLPASQASAAPSISRLPTKKPLRRRRPSPIAASASGTKTKKPKLNTLQEAQQDWKSFVQKNDIETELRHRNKDGYVERQEFLAKTEIARELQLRNLKKK